MTHSGQQKGSSLNKQGGKNVRTGFAELVSQLEKRKEWGGRGPRYQKGVKRDTSKHPPPPNTHPNTRHHYTKNKTPNTKNSPHTNTNQLNKKAKNTNHPKHPKHHTPPNHTINPSQQTKPKRNPHLKENQSTSYKTTHHIPLTKKTVTTCKYQENTHSNL